VGTQRGFEVLSRTRLFSGQFVPRNLRAQNYSVAADGKTFLMVQPMTGPGQALVVTLGWSQR
jgi:hypothetical protein